jgi:SAM-dependent MidA family methyltransferase
MILSDIIKSHIQNHGPISFKDFMEMALYYPGLGYYTSVKDKIGEKGDYYTSPNLTPLFGAMIARQIEDMWAILGKEPFTIVEYGAGTGMLCRDILDYLKNNRKLYDDLRYCIIEKSPVMIAREKNHLHEKVSWHNFINDIAEIKGCVLSNELVDNFAVHQVLMQKELMEVFVDYNNGSFIEIFKPASKGLIQYMEEIGIKLPEGFRSEVNLEATDWIRQIASSLQKGYVLTIDYGFLSSQLYQPARSSGTILCYCKHGVNDHPYENIGGQDITSHVNFSALDHWGFKYGLQRCGYTDQGHFLSALGFIDYLKMADTPERNNLNYYKKRFFLIHTLLVDMGSKYKVLIQRKAAPDQHLLGLRFS